MSSCRGRWLYVHNSRVATGRALVCHTDKARTPTRLEGTKWIDENCATSVNRIEQRLLFGSSHWEWKKCQISAKYPTILPVYYLENHFNNQAIEYYFHVCRDEVGEGSLCWQQISGISSFKLGQISMCVKRIVCSRIKRKSKLARSRLFSVRY